MKCIICNQNKPKYTSSLNHACGVSVPIGIKHDICAECFDESLITGVKNTSLLEYNTLEFAKRQQINHLKRELNLQRQDVLTYQEVFDMFRGVGFLESMTKDPKEQAKRVKKIIEGYKIPNFDIPDGKNLGLTTTVVFRKSDIDKFCVKYKKEATWYAHEKSQLSAENVNRLFDLGYIKYNHKNQPMFANNLKEKKRPCVCCGEIKDFDEFRKTNCNVWSCLKCEGQKQKKYYQDNREECLDRSKTWRKNNRDKINAYNKQPKQKAYHNVRKRLREFMRRTGKTYSKEVGCTVTEFKLHLQSQFQDGMTWQNYGSGENGDHKDCWHIDHIIPLAAWDEYNDNPDLSPNHYTNLQPLWAKDNLSKGRSI